MTSVIAAATVRPYRPADRGACLAAFDSTLPTSFTPDERDLFARFLDEKALAPDRPFAVAERDGRVLGCGGHRVDGYGVASFAWGLVHRDHHRTGLGTALVEHRLQAVRRVPHAWAVILDTSHHAAPFYGRWFETVRTVPDGYQPGLDKVFMRLVLR